MVKQQFILLLILGPVLLNACHYQYTSITVDSKLGQPECSSSTNTSSYQCTSLNKMFDLLLDQTCCNISYSTRIDVFIAGSYRLNSSYMMKNLCNVRFIGSANSPATIQCVPNFDSGLAFIAVRNLTIEYLTIIGCGMKHVSTNENNVKGNFIDFRSALFIQNSTIFLNNVNISNNDGKGLSFYDTNGIVMLTNSFFMYNLLNLEGDMNKINEFGGGGVYIEFTKCSPGQTACDPYGNSYNSNSKYVVENCTFANNLAVSSTEDFADNLAIATFLHLSRGGALSFWFDGQAYNNSIVITSCIFD